MGAIAGKVRSNLVAAPILKEQIGPVRVEGTIVEIDAANAAGASASMSARLRA